VGQKELKNGVKGELRDGIDLKKSSLF
jgi:hypothetical protein